RRSCTASGGALARRPPAAKGHHRAEPDRQHRRVSARLRRHRWLALAIVGPLALASCGWAPLYADAEVEPASGELRPIRVDPIPERLGQRLEMALRNSLNPSGEPTPSRYILKTTPSVGLSNLGVQAQGLATLGQLDVYVTYLLVDLQSGGTLLTNTVHV